MKKQLLFVLLSCITPSLAAQSKQYLHQTVVDQNGKKTSFYKEKKITVAEEKALTNVIKRYSGSNTRDGNPVYVPIMVNYVKIKKAIEEIAGRSYADMIFLLEYSYLNNRCNSNGNSWNKRAINERKQFTTLHKKEIEKRNPEVVILNIFEQGFTLSNSPDSKKEYFFTEKDNLLRKNLFNQPALCGSFALIKPNGQTLIHNGESSAWYMEQHLKPDNWDLFFPLSK